VGSTTPKNVCKVITQNSMRYFKAALCLMPLDEGDFSGMELIIPLDEHLDKDDDIG